MTKYKTQGELIEEGYEPVFELIEPYQEYDGSWHAYLMDHTLPSNRNYIEGGEFATEAEAQAWMDDVQAGLDDRDVDVTHWDEPSPWEDYNRTESAAWARGWAS